MQRLSLLLLLPLIVACSTAHPRTDVYTENHPIAVETIPMGMTVQILDDGTLAPITGPCLRDFVRAWLEAGIGPISVIGDADKLVHVADALDELTVPGSAIILQPCAGPCPGRATLAFAGAGVRLPPCGIGPDSPAFQSTNAASSNWACSTQRNLGMMVADPRTLYEARPMDGPDTERTGVVQGYHRTPSRAADPQSSISNVQ
ncbi:MAG: CpaD family pilus assembly lipoprotein [Pseudomonadota bacterium]|nr:CpaD family pilus assembly lipoprotein [Pseudomonadota bacterium]